MKCYFCRCKTPLVEWECKILGNNKVHFTVFEQEMPKLAFIILSVTIKWVQAGYPMEKTAGHRRADINKQQTNNRPMGNLEWLVDQTPRCRFLDGRREPQCRLRFYRLNMWLAPFPYTAVLTFPIELLSNTLYLYQVRYDNTATMHH